MDGIQKLIVTAIVLVLIALIGAGTYYYLGLPHLSITTIPQSIEVEREFVIEGKSRNLSDLKWQVGDSIFTEVSQFRFRYPIESAGTVDTIFFSAISPSGEQQQIYQTISVLPPKIVDCGKGFGDQYNPIHFPDGSDSISIKLNFNRQFHSKRASIYNNTNCTIILKIKAGKSTGLFKQSPSELSISPKSSSDYTFELRELETDSETVRFEAHYEETGETVTTFAAIILNSTAR